LASISALSAAIQNRQNFSQKSTADEKARMTAMTQQFFFRHFFAPDFDLFIFPSRVTG
jgi:hypothetical protein